MAVSTDMAANVDMTPPLYTYSQFAVDYAKALCARLVACGKQDNATLDTCIVKNTLLVGWDVDSELVRGRIALNPQPCLDAVKNQRCDASDNGFVTKQCAIQTLLVPHQNAGDVCLADAECTTTYCAHALTDGGMTPQATGCPGTCAKTAGAGESCVSDAQCGLGNQCNNNTCALAKADGATCDFVNDTIFCQPFTSYCPITTTNATCRQASPPAGLHGACDPIQATALKPPCNSDTLYCKLVQNANTTWSATCETKIPLGGVCDPNFGQYPAPGVFDLTTVVSQCADGSVCVDFADGNGPHCRAWGQKSSSCVVFHGATNTCQAGYLCDPTSKTCQNFKPNGAACVNSSECASSTGATPTCVIDNADAGSQATCQPYKAVGAACTPVFENSLCVPAAGSDTSYCAPTVNGGGTCSPKCL
jgi:hypothetical protein